MGMHQNQKINKDVWKDNLVHRLSCSKMHVVLKKKAFSPAGTPLLI
jgi:hypothetical protein